MPASSTLSSVLCCIWRSIPDLRPHCPHPLSLHRRRPLASAAACKILSGYDPQWIIFESQLVRSLFWSVPSAASLTPPMSSFSVLDVAQPRPRHSIRSVVASWISLWLFQCSMPSIWTSSRHQASGLVHCMQSGDPKFDSRLWQIKPHLFIIWFISILTCGPSSWVIPMLPQQSLSTEQYDQVLSAQLQSLQLGSPRWEKSHNFLRFSEKLLQIFKSC
jgi:hypothetical protein